MYTHAYKIYSTSLHGRYMFHYLVILSFLLKASQAEKDKCEFNKAPYFYIR